MAIGQFIYVHLQICSASFTSVNANKKYASTLGDDDGELLVTFFNGETVCLKRGIAIRIPEQKFNQLSFDIQLPESQRRKQSVHRRSVSRPTRKTVWEDERRELQLVLFVVYIYFNGSLTRGWHAIRICY